MSASAWTPWRPLPPLPGRAPASPAVFCELIDGGQAFRWGRATDSAPDAPVFEGGWLHHHVRVRLCPRGDGAVEFSVPDRSDPAAEAAALHRYLSGPVADEDALPWRSDASLREAMRAFPGLRILRQPFGETLLGFICSATKQIPQIKRMMAELAARHGRPAPGSGRRDADAWRALPDWAELASVSDDQLRACSLGFRARHVAGVARRLAAEPGWLEATEAASYPEAKARLLELPGVGEKIADCVLLFGAGRLEAFPVDTWIVKAMARRYGLDGWSPEQIARFGRVHFGPQAGLAQQYIFAHERARARRP